MHPCRRQKVFDEVDMQAGDRSIEGVIPEPISRLAFVIAGISFVPLFGVPFGIAAVLWGLFRLDRDGGKVAVVGAGGILFSVLLYGGLFYFGFVKRGGLYDHLREELASTMLTNLVSEIEFYRVEHGHYPRSLEDLSGGAEDPAASIYDPTVVSVKGKQRLFYYKLTQDSSGYYLRGVGQDGVPFTADDLLPEVAHVPGSKIGLRLGRPGDNVSAPHQGGGKAPTKPR